MFAATVTILLGLTSLLSAQLPYETIAHKGDMRAPLNVQLDAFYIPEGQCTGWLDNLLVCPGGNQPRAVRVTARDYAPYPRVLLADDLSSASVLRASKTNFCPGLAQVTVELSCLEY